MVPKYLLFIQQKVQRARNREKIIYPNNVLNLYMLATRLKRIQYINNLPCLCVPRCGLMETQNQGLDASGL